MFNKNKFIVSYLLFLVIVGSVSISQLDINRGKDVEVVNTPLRSGAGAMIATTLTQVDIDEIKTITVSSDEEIINDENSYETNVEVENENTYEVCDSEENYDMYVTELINVRSEPNTESEVIDKLPIKSEVEVTGEVVDENWVRIDMDGQEAYVCSDYLVESTEGIEAFTYNYNWTGPKLNAYSGRVQGPSGSETFYNLDMSGVIKICQSQGIYGEYWVRSDGAKMYGNYIMCAANLNLRPRGSLVETSLGTGIVVDTGTFAQGNPTGLDIATNW